MGRQQFLVKEKEDLCNWIDVFWSQDGIESAYLRLNIFTESDFSMFFSEAKQRAPVLQLMKVEGHKFVGRKFSWTRDYHCKQVNNEGER